MRLARCALSRAMLLIGVATALSCGGDPPTPPTEPIVAVDLPSTTINLAPNATLQLTATARSAVGDELTGRTFSWSVMNTSVATVSASGLVTGVSDGTTTVTATADGKSDSATVTVRTPVATVEITPNPVEVVRNGRIGARLTAITRSANGTTLEGRAIVWTSSNMVAATVSQSGAVIGYAKGSTTITATSEGQSGTAVVTVVEPVPCGPGALPTLTVGTVYDGVMAASDCRLSDGSVAHTFTLSANSRNLLEIEMTSATVDSHLSIIDVFGNTVAEDNDGGAGKNARVVRGLVPTNYLLTARSFNPNEFGPYQLTVRVAPAVCSTGRTISFPGSLDATLTVAGSCRLNDDALADRYQIVIPARTAVRIDMTSSAVDSHLYLADSSGRFLAQDDDAGPGANARIEAQLDAGRYTVLATGLPGQTGNYRLDVVPVSDPCAATRTLIIGQPVNGTLSANDCVVGSRGPTPFTQRFLLNVTTAGPLQFDMTSNSVDAYLVIQNSVTGAVVAENDDVSASSTNARVGANFSAGQYIVNATTHDTSEVGDYTLAVTTIAPSTPVSIAILPTTLSLAAGAEQPLTATVTGTANNSVTWHSSANGVATVTTAGRVRGVTPGTATITARSEADPSKTATVQVTVTQSTGAPNLDIAAMYLVQSVQELDNSVELIANRDAVARVYLRGSQLGMAAAEVRVRVYQGTTLLQTLQASVTPTLRVDERCCSANITIPANFIRSGISVVADADPQNVVAEANETDNSYPLNGTKQAFNVITVPDFNITLVPIQQVKNGQTGVAAASVLNTMRSLWPLATVNITTRAALVIDYALVGTAFDEWGQLLRDLELARRADGSNAYYYGLVRETYTSGVLGLAGGIPAMSAAGVDEGSGLGPAEAKYRLAHEIGHLIGLRHAPCGVSATDPAYPFPDGRTGAFGLDIAAGNIVKVPNGTDIMSECDNQWASVYNYRNVLGLRARNPGGSPASLIASAPATPVLLISGSVNSAQASIDGSFAVTTAPNKQDPAGRFVLEGFAADGKILLTHRFSPFAVADGKPGEEAFVVGVPVSDETRARVARLAVREVNGLRQDARVRNATMIATRASSPLISVQRNAAGTFSLKWSKAVAPMMMVRNAATGELLGISRSGNLDISQFQRVPNVELLLSDGISSVRHSVNTKTGAIRQ